MIDLRHEFDKEMNEYGSYILLVHNNRKIRCSCWNDKTNEAEKECKFCYGLGNTPIIEKHICRSKTLNASESLSSIVQPSDYGDNMIPSRCFYLKNNVDASPKDLIIDCIFDDNGAPSLYNYYIYEINYVDKMRGDKGRFEFIRAYCHSDAVNMDIVTYNIRKSGNKEIYQISFRR